MKFSTLIIVIVIFLSSIAFAGSSTKSVLSDEDLLKMAGNKYASGELPLGDGHYVTDGPRKGYIYLCHIMNNGDGGAQRDGEWIHGQTWNIFKKIYIKGQVAWNNAWFNNKLEENTRVLTGNGLPISHATGTFPVEQSDPAYYYDRNPNSIREQNVHDALPKDPVYSDTPYCMGGESGIMLTGVPLYNGFDASMRDAAAHELQDSCMGHPQMHGQYHYHSISACIKNTNIKTIIGYALDGFPITGPMVAKGKYLTTEDLDECHGITSEINDNGEKKVTYHYVMTQDFPYSVSCFRGKPERTEPSDKMQGGMMRNNNMQQGPGHGRMGPPPQALEACNGRPEGDSCSFISPRGDNISGLCHTHPDGNLACKPDNMR